MKRSARRNTQQVVVSPAGFPDVNEASGCASPGIGNTPLKRLEDLGSAEALQVAPGRNNR